MATSPMPWTALPNGCTGVFREHDRIYVYMHCPFLIDSLNVTLYDREKYGRDPPKTTTVVPDDTVVETDVYTTVDRHILGRACQEYIEQQRPKRRRCARK